MQACTQMQPEPHGPMILQSMLVPVPDLRLNEALSQSAGWMPRRIMRGVLAWAEGGLHPSLDPRAWENALNDPLSLTNLSK